MAENHQESASGPSRARVHQLSSEPAALQPRKHYNFWALAEGAPFGVSLHFVDTGDVVAQREIPYDLTDTGETLYRKAQREIVRLFREEYPRLRTLDILRKPQDLSKGSFHLARGLPRPAVLIWTATTASAGC